MGLRIYRWDKDAEDNDDEDDGQWLRRALVLFFT